MLRGRVEKLAQAKYPRIFQNPAFRGQIYRLVDMVLDMPSVVETLAARHREAIFSIDWNKAKLAMEHSQGVIQLPGTTVIPQRLIFTAGTGNEQLIASIGGSEPRMQRRPLQQVLVKHHYDEPLYAHCMGGNPSPRLTISSHHTRRGEPVWYLGGDLATEGEHDSPDTLIEKAKRELNDLLPWIDLGNAQWRTVKLDRAEPRQSGLLRPDRAYLGKVNAGDNVFAAWPTKLTLSPDLADEIERELEANSIVPIHQPDLSRLAGLGSPEIAASNWDLLFS